MDYIADKSRSLQSIIGDQGTFSSALAWPKWQKRGMSTVCRLLLLSSITCCPPHIYAYLQMPHVSLGTIFAVENSAAKA